MIVYVETNFVLELAFLQEEHGHCMRLLEFAKLGNIELVIPAYSIGEPYEKLVRRRKERKDLSDRLRKEIGELSRSAPYADNADRYAELARLLIDSNEHENQRLTESLQRILGIATVIPTDGDVLNGALDAQHNLGLSPQDAIVYASVIRHLGAQSAPRCFINKNTRDFLEPRVAAEFKKSACNIIPAFSHGVAHVEAHINAHEGESHDSDE